MIGVSDSWSEGFDFHAMKYESKPLLNQPGIFYFQHKDRVYPVLILTVENSDFKINLGTFAFILHDQSQNGDDGFEAILRLSTNKSIRSLSGQTDNIIGEDSNPAIQNFLHSEYNWKDYNGYTWSNLEPGMLWKDRPNKYAIGLGAIGTYDD